MTPPAKGLVLSVSEIATAGEHPTQIIETFAVAPSSADEQNRLRSPLVPRACFKIEDAIFAFDSSFIAFGRSPDVVQLKEILDKNPGAKLSIFGHADPVGRDDYNKVLSGRRARAVYGMLMQDPKEWDPLYFEHDTNGKDRWGLKSIQIMLNAEGESQAGAGTQPPVVRTDGVMDDRTREKLRDFQSRSGLSPTPFGPAPDHLVDRGTFEALAAKYMNILCLVDKVGGSLKLSKTDFLAQGARKDGKGDYQGCTEFNPVVVFSREEQKRLDRPENKLERDVENEPNRRVMILVFRAGTRVDPARWPCPAATEGIAGCRKRFFKAVAGTNFKDGDERRAPATARREFEATKDTFGCRFYQSMVEFSPCERILRSAEMRFYDAKDQFIPRAAFRVLALDAQPIGGDRFAEPDGTALITAVLPRVRVLWGRPQMVNGQPTFPESLPFSLDVRLDVVVGSEEQRALASLNNLGYVRGPTREDNIAAFRRDHGISAGTTLDKETTAELLRLQKELPDRIHQPQQQPS